MPKPVITSSLPGTELQSVELELTKLAAHIYAATYRFIELIYIFDTESGWAAPGLKSCAHWLNWKCGMAMGTAREHVRVAHALAHLPQISEAFRKGQVSYSNVRAMTRVATPENEDFLLMIARHGTAHHVERLVRHYRRHQRLEALDEANRQHEQRELQCYRDHDGSWIVKARLTPEQGAQFKAALKAAMDEDYNERKDVSDETPEAQGPENEPIDARRADALTRMAASFLAGGHASTGGDRYTIHLHADMDTLRATGMGAEAELEEGGCVSAETSRRLACDAGVVPWHEDDASGSLNIGRKTRTIPPAIRRALQLRDRGCRFPGCTAERHVDAHHIHHWADGGETRVDNLVLLCRHHHRLIHEGGFQVEMGAGQQPKFCDPDGEPIPLSASIPFSGNVTDLIGQHQARGLDIDPSTPIPEWHGEPMDYDLGILALVQRE